MIQIILFLLYSRNKRFWINAIYPNLQLLPWFTAMWNWFVGVCWFGVFEVLFWGWLGFFYTFCSQLCCHQLNYYFSLAFKILTLPFVTPYAYQNAGNLQIKRYKLSWSCLSKWFPIFWHFSRVALPVALEPYWSAIPSPSSKTHALFVLPLFLYLVFQHSRMGMGSWSLKTHMGIPSKRVSCYSHS